jgi:hypothetical protein
MDLLNPLSVARARSLFVERKMAAKCLVTDNIGDCVYIRADLDPSGVPRVGRVNPKSAAKMPAVAIIIDKDSASDCTIQWIGEMTSTGLTYNKPAFVGLDGRLTQTPSTLVPDVGGVLYVQHMGIAMSSDLLLLIPNLALVKRIG